MRLQVRLERGPRLSDVLCDASAFLWHGGTPSDGEKVEYYAVGTPSDGEKVEYYAVGSACYVME